MSKSKCQINAKCSNVKNYVLDSMDLEPHLNFELWHLTLVHR
jgi:hypothetical protein